MKSEAGHSSTSDGGLRSVVCISAAQVHAVGELGGTGSTFGQGASAGQL